MFQASKIQQNDRVSLGSVVRTFEWGGPKATNLRYSETSQKDRSYIKHETRRRLLKTCLLFS